MDKAMALRVNLNLVPTVPSASCPSAEEEEEEEEGRSVGQGGA